MKKYKCLVGNCYRTSVGQTRYCEAHQIYKIQKDLEIAKRLNELPKSSMYQTNEWKRLRAEVIREQECCTYCGSHINLQVHHIKRHYGNPNIFFDKENLLVVCEQCHSKISMRQVKGR